MTLRTDINLAPLPQTIPNVGGLLGKNAIVVDPDFGTQIMRLTDGGDATFHSMQTADSSGALIWNANDTLIFARSTGGTAFLYQFDPIALQGTKLSFSTQGTPCFSATTPGWFYILSGSVITKYIFTLVGGVWTFSSSSTVCDFVNILPAGFHVNWSSEFLISNDDTTFSAGFSEGAQNTGFLACVYQTGHGGSGLGFRMANTTTGQITGDWGPTGAITLTSDNATFPFTLHEVVMTPNPLYTVMGPHGLGSNGAKLDTTIVWAIGTLTFTDQNADGHKAKGFLHTYTGAAGGGQLSEIPYVNPVKPYRQVVPHANLPPNYAGDRHFAFGKMASDDASIVWCDNGGPLVPQPFKSAWEGEVFGYDIVAGVVYRACHTFNSFKSKKFIVAEAICVPSQTGNFVAFTSDWLGSLGSETGGQDGILGVNARGDVFIVRLSTTPGLGTSSTAIVSSANPANAGDTVTFTVTASSTGSNPPTGTVTLYDGVTVLASDILDTSQQASFDISTLAAGAHSIRAGYGGDANNTASTSPVLVETIVALTSGGGPPLTPSVPTDAFDSYLNKFATILTRTAASAGGYGAAPSFSPVDVGVPCRVSTNSVSGDLEFRMKSKENIAFKKVFLRPWFLDQSPDSSHVPDTSVGGVLYNTQPLTHDHWFQIEDDMYDIYELHNPGGLNHHLEVWCRLVLV